MKTLSFWIIAALVVFPRFAYAEKYAIVVGINHYPNLPERFQLEGAVNDAHKMADVLPRFGFSPKHIALMTDDAVSSLSPTRQHIMTNMALLVERAKADDVVLLYFAGHGSQQPVVSKRKSNEPDDLDEIFLPSDVNRWNGQKKAVENAIIDDEFDQVLSKLKAKGVFTVAMFDTCHAGSMARGELELDENDDKIRGVPAESLGIPTLLLSPKEQIRGAARPKQRLPKMRSHDGFVAFYASQSDQKTKEMRDATGMHRGLFSYHLLQALEQASKKGEASFRQIAEAVLAKYKEDRQLLVSPQFEGDGLDFLVFNPDQQRRVLQWQVTRSSEEFLIPAGKLHQFAQGTLFSLHRHAYDEEVLGYATADIVEENRTRLSLNNAATILPATFYARLKSIQTETSLVIGVRPDDKLAQRLIAKLDQTKNKQGITWQNTMGNADYLLVNDQQKPNLFCLISRSATALKQRRCNNPYARITLPKTWGSTKNALVHLAQKLQLPHRLLSASEELHQTHLLDRLELELVQIKAGKEEVIAFDRVPPTVHTGEHLQLKIKNRSQRALDITILVLDSAYGVKRLFPSMSGANRIEAGAQLPLALHVTPTPKGVEDVLVFVSEVQPLQISDFSFLTQEGYNANSTQSQEALVRGQYQAWQTLSSLLQAAHLPATRGTQEHAIPQTAIAKITWRTQ